NREPTLEAPLDLRKVTHQGAEVRVRLRLGKPRDSRRRSNGEALPILDTSTETHTGVTVTPIGVLLGSKPERVTGIKAHTGRRVAVARDLSNRCDKVIRGRIPRNRPIRGLVQIRRYR